MRVAARLVFVVGVVSSAGVFAQCTKDIECKGDRICSAGICVAPMPLDASSTDIPSSLQAPRDSQESPPNNRATPSFEVGRMLAESGVGIAIAAAITVLPYLALFGGGALSGDSTLSSLLFVVLFAAVPLVTAPVEFAIANGSRSFHSDLWPPMVAGIATEAAVLGIFYATGWLPTPHASGGVPNGGSVPLVLIGTIAVVPLVEMAVINIFKQPIQTFNQASPRSRRGDGVMWAPPALVPIFMASDGRKATGVQLSLLRGAW